MGDFATPPPPWKVQWMLTDRGGEDTSCRSAGFSAPLCTFSPVCDLKAVQEGARRSLVPPLSRLHEHVKRESSGSQEEEDNDRSGDDREDDLGVFLKRWISCPHFLSAFCLPF